MKTRKHEFTLIEILTVILIIGVLAGMLFPVVGHIQERGRIAEAKTLVSGMKAAVLAYQTEYNCLPNPGNATAEGHLGKWECASETADPGKDQNYLKLCSILAFTNCEQANQAGNVSTTAANLNPHGTRFMSPTKNMFKKESLGICDPWDFELVVFMDYDGDGQVKSTNAFDSSGATTYLSPVVVFCRGSQSTKVLSKITKNNIICSERR